MPTKKWTEEEEEFLKENFAAMSNAELAEKFGITKNAVQKKLARMNLKRAEVSLADESDEYDDDEDVEVEKKHVVDVDSHFYKANSFYYEERDYANALKEYQLTTEEETDELIKLKAFYWMGECYLRLLKLDEAREIFNNLAENYSSHYLGDSAKRRLKELEDFVIPGS